MVREQDTGRRPTPPLLKPPLSAAQSDWAAQPEGRRGKKREGECGSVFQQCLVT